jgi:hypothetical protein
MRTSRSGQRGWSRLACCCNFHSCFCEWDFSSPFSVILEVAGVLANRKGVNGMMKIRCLSIWIVLVAITGKAEDATDPFSLAPVVSAMERYEDAVEKARKLLVNSLKGELKASTKRGDFNAAKELQSLIAHLDQGNDPATFVAGEGGLVQPAAGARWVPIPPDGALAAITIYPNVPRGLPARAILKQHVEGNLAQTSGGTVAMRNERGLYFVPPQPGATFFAICAVRTKAPTTLTLRVSGNPGYGVTQDVVTFVNGTNVPNSGEVMLPTGNSLILLKIQTNPHEQRPAGDYWFRCELFVDADKAEVHIPAAQ